MLTVGSSFANPFQSSAFQSEYLRYLVENSGSANLKQMLQSGTMSDDELVQYVLEHPEEMEGAQGQGTPFVSSASSASAASASSSASSSSSSAPSDSYSPSDDSDSDGDPDLQPFSQDETMAAPSMCAMGGVDAADKAKPEMQQNLKECKAISKALSEMESQSDGDSGLSSAISQCQEKEEIIRACLRRGKGKADDGYKSQGIDPKDMDSVSKFVAQLGKDVIDIGTQNGLDIEVSQQRAQRLQDAGGQVAGAQGPNPRGGQAANQNPQQPAPNQNQNQGLGQGQGGGDDEFQIQSQKVDKQVQLGVDQVEQNPAMLGAITEQLTQAWEKKQQEGAGFQAPTTFDLGETREGSPLDQAFTAPPPPRADGGDDGGEQPPVGAAAPQGPSLVGQPMGSAVAAAPQVGGLAGGPPTDIRALMNDLGMTGQKFNAKIQVYDVGQSVALSKGGGGGVKVNGSLQGKAINVKVPKMVARGADGQEYAISGLHGAGGSGSFMAVIKGDATGTEQAAQAIHTSGDGSIAIPGTKAA